MRNNTRIVLEKIVEFLTDNSIASAGGEGVYDALNPRPGAKSTSALGNAIMQVVASTESLSEVESEKLLSEVLSQPGVFDIELVKQALRDPLAQVAQQFLAPQGIHNTFVQLSEIVSRVESSPLGDQIDERISGEDANIEEEAQSATPVGEDPDDVAADIENKTGVKELETLKGGFYVIGHEKWLSQNPLKPHLAENVKSENNQSSPSKSDPAFTYCGFIDPMQPFARKEAALAAAVATLIPTIEWSRAIPYFSMKILSPPQPYTEEEGATPVVRSSLSIDEFFAGGISGLGATAGPGSSRFTDLPVSSSFADRLVGMEAFTMPQAILPTGRNLEAQKFSSIDSTRPFMTIKDFSASVTPTRGTGSSMRASLSLVLHDRGRMPQVAALLKPATLSQYAFDIEWGWSHPSGDPLSDNIYGQFINTLRTRQIFTLYQTSYSFTADGQVEIKCDLVTKGVNVLNELDCGTVTTVPADETVDLALKNVKKAAESIGGVNLRGIEGADSLGHLRTLDKGSLGALIDGKVKAKLQRAYDSTGEPDLNLLSSLLNELIGAVNGATATAQANIEQKIKHMLAHSYDKYEVYAKAAVDLHAGLAQNFVVSEKVAGGAIKKSGYVPLGAIIESFIVHPLFTTGMYDEIQLVTYTANLNAGGAAGANLGSLPIQLSGGGGPSFSEMMKDQVTQYGGQYPISRFIRFLAQNYVELQAAPLYGVVEGGTSSMKYDAGSGKLVPKTEDKNLAKKVKKKLLQIYYGEGTAGTPAEPRPTPFTPIKLKIIFDVAPANPIDSLGEDMAAIDVDVSPRTVLRIHVVDEAAGTSSTQGWMQILKQAKSGGGVKGILIPPVPRRPPEGMSVSALLYSNIENNFLSAARVCQWLEGQNVLNIVPPKEGSEEEANLQEIAKLEATIDNRAARLKLTTIDSEEREALQKELDEHSMRWAALQQNRPKSTPYFMAGSGAAVIDLVSQTAPNLVYGREGSIATSITVKQKTDSGASTTYMMRALRGTNAGKEGSTRGLPMRIMAADVGVEMFGNPLVKYMQQFFVNTNSGTTIDNLYAVIGIEHKITKESYKTSLTMAPQEAYGIFESLSDTTDKAIAALDALKQLKARRDYNQDVAEAGAYLSSVKGVHTEQVEELESDITTILSAVTKVWSDAAHATYLAFQTAAATTAARVGTEYYVSTDYDGIWDQWINSKGSYGLMQYMFPLFTTSGGAQHACYQFMYSCSQLYATYINTLQTHEPLIHAVAAVLSNMKTQRYSDPNAAATQFITLCLDWWLTNGWLPVWMNNRVPINILGNTLPGPKALNDKPAGNYGVATIWFTDRFSTGTGNRTISTFKSSMTSAAREMFGGAEVFKGGGNPEPPNFYIPTDLMSAGGFISSAGPHVTDERYAAESRKATMRATSSPNWGRYVDLAMLHIDDGAGMAPMANVLSLRAQIVFAQEVLDEAQAEYDTTVAGGPG